MSWLKRICIVILACTLALPPVALYADDDDDDDRKRSRHHRKKVWHDADYVLYCPCPAPSAPAVKDAPAPMPPAKSSARRPDDFPTETPTERASARERQLDLLEKELEEERRLLARANAANAQDDIQMHQRNIVAIRRELARLYQ